MTCNLLTYKKEKGGGGGNSHTAIFIRVICPPILRPVLHNASRNTRHGTTAFTLYLCTHGFRQSGHSIHLHLPTLTHLLTHSQTRANAKGSDMT
jgi:hypothetical protein